MVSGWVHRLRGLGGVSFLLLRDRTGIAQLVCAGGVDVTLESVVRATGVVRQNKKAPHGYELQVTDLTVLSPAVTPLPYQPNQNAPVGLETTLQHRTLSLRAPRINACFRVQASILDHFGRHMRAEGFTEIKSSKLVASGTEGGTGLFRVEYFDRAVFLAQSPQFYKQAMVASGMERVFEIGAAYRAEKHETARHLNEYISLDVEWGFIDTAAALMDLEVRILGAIATGVRADCAALIDEYDFPIPDPARLENAPRLAYKDALAIIAEETGGGGHGGGSNASRGGGGGNKAPVRIFEIAPEGERMLSQWAEREHQSDLVFVHGFPLRKRPFYTQPDGNATHSFDCIFRGVEITTGGLRIHNYDQLVESVEFFGLRPDTLTHYLDIFRYGCPPHGGFAIGLERLTQKFCGLDSVKEAALFPRDRSRVTP